MSFKISDLYHKWLDSVVILIDDQTGEHDGMVGHDANAARPHLGRCNLRRMNHDLVFLPIEGGGCFKPCNV